MATIMALRSILTVCSITVEEIHLLIADRMHAFRFRWTNLCRRFEASI
jgi:hypothetical protein